MDAGLEAHHQLLLSWAILVPVRLSAYYNVSRATAHSSPIEHFVKMQIFCF